MSIYGRVTVGGFRLQETFEVARTASGLALKGEESTPPASSAYVVAAGANVEGLDGRAVPVVFDSLTGLDGFYRVAESQAETYQRDHIIRTRWSLSLERLGTGRDVEHESRLLSVARPTDHAGITASFWHAAPVGYGTYYTGTTVPASQVTRVSADGDVLTHLGVPSSVSPRWTASPAVFMAGAARLLVDGVQRIGTSSPAGGWWQVHNGLVRVSAGAAGDFEVACWDSGAWRSVKAWVPTVAGAALTAAPEVTVLRNDPEEVVVRLTYPTTPHGLTTVDLGVRRGARFVTGVMRRHSSSTLGIKRATNEAGAAETGRVRATADDSDGNRYVIGSSKTYTADTTAGGISKASVLTLDFFVGHAVNGGTAAAGDTPADLIAQYLGASGERVVTVRR